MERIRRFGRKETAKKMDGTGVDGGIWRYGQDIHFFILWTPVFVVFRFSHAWGTGAEANVSSRVNNGYLHVLRSTAIRISKGLGL